MNIKNDKYFDFFRMAPEVILQNNYDYRVIFFEDFFLVSVFINTEDVHFSFWFVVHEIGWYLVSWNHSHWIGRDVTSTLFCTSHESSLSHSQQSTPSTQRPSTLVIVSSNCFYKTKSKNSRIRNKVNNHQINESYKGLNSFVWCFLFELCGTSKGQKIFRIF